MNIDLILRQQLGFEMFLSFKILLYNSDLTRCVNSPNRHHNKDSESPPKLLCATPIPSRQLLICSLSLQLCLFHSVIERELYSLTPILHHGFIEMKFTHHVIRPFKVYNSLVGLTGLYTHRRGPDRTFSSPLP